MPTLSDTMKELKGLARASEDWVNLNEICFTLACSGNVNKNSVMKNVTLVLKYSSQSYVSFVHTSPNEAYFLIPRNCYLSTSNNVSFSLSHFPFLGIFLR